MLDNFVKALKLVLVDEGGLDDDPHDHGGRTAYGIIQREYSAYRRRKGLQPQDVWKISPAEVSEIYHTQYWDPWCDKLPAGLDYAYFDDAVNTGPIQATRNLQRAMGSVRVDGYMGQVTLDAANAADPAQLVRDYCAMRRKFYRGLAQFPRYGRGWLNRVAHVEKAAMQMAAGVTPTRTELSPELKAQATARAKAEDKIKPPVSPEAAGSVAGATGVGAGTLQEITNQITPFADTIHWVKYVLLAIAMVGAGFMLYGVWFKAKHSEGGTEEEVTA